MKRIMMRHTRGIEWLMMGFLLILLGYSNHAWTQVVQDCVVNQVEDKANVPNTLRWAVEAYHDATGGKTQQECGKSITIVKNIELTSPIEFTETPAATPFVLGGPESGSIEIDASKVEGDCAITIPSNFKIRNLRISGKPGSTTKAICIKGNNNVIVNTVSSEMGGGFHFADGTQGNRVLGFSGAAFSTGVGIEIEGSASDTLSTLVIPDYLVLFGNKGGELKSPVDAEVQTCWNQVDEQNQIYQGYGQVADKSGKKISPRAIYVFRNFPDLGDSTLDLLTRSSMIAYLGAQGSNLDIKSGAFNLAVDGGIIDSNGRFEFLYNASFGKNVYIVAQIHENEVSSSSMVYKLSGITPDGNCKGNKTGGSGGAFGGSGVIGGEDFIGYVSRTACKIDHQNQDFTHDITYDSDLDGIPDRDEDINGNCEYDKALGETDAFNPDSDHDGIRDNVELANTAVNGYVQCYDKSGELVQVDSIDPTTGNKEKVDADVALERCKAPGISKKERNSCLSNIFAPNTRAPKDCLNSSGVLKAGYTFGTQTDPIVFDTDQDGKWDGEEDRSLGFNKLTPSFWKDFEKRKINTVSLVKGQPKSKVGTCQQPPGYEKVGRSYQLVKLTKNPENGELTVEAGVGIESVSGVDELPADGNTYYQWAICDSGSVIPTDFDGSYDGSLEETDPRKADTDGDLWCDGSNGIACQDVYGLKGQGLQDECPNKKFEVSNKCTPICTDGLIFKFMDPNSEFVEINESGVVIGLAKDATGKYILLEEPKEIIDLYCADSDQDGIPNCVESPLGLCVPTDSGYTQPFNPDSDGDNIGDDPKGDDSHDLCPNDPDDKCVEKCKYDNTKLCDVNNLNVTNPAMAMFIDRDGDTLKDFEEDLNGNGIVDDWESSPLMVDTDGDDLNDDVEVEILKDKFPANLNSLNPEAHEKRRLNPNNPDTDGDSISDADEIKAGDKPLDYEPTLNKEIGCLADLAGMLRDTDPTLADTDGDGITDSNEINVTGTNPNNWDSDGDTLSDLEEDTNQNGKWPGSMDDQGNILPLSTEFKTDSNPCLADTDGDGLEDGDPLEAGSCKAQPGGGSCKDTGNDKVGFDSDLDGLPDIIEAQWGTLPDNWDTDGDNLADGCIDGVGEACYAIANNSYQLAPTTQEAWDNGKLMTNPLEADSDGDGLNDNLERKYGTKPWVKDSDGDGLEDGIEDANKDGEWNLSETNANEMDTDGDGLFDGPLTGNCGITQPYIQGEDRNCDGIVSANETDPRRADTDGDGRLDKEEICLQNGCLEANISNALAFSRQGCSLDPASQSLPGHGWMLIMAAVLPALIMRRRLQLKESGHK